MTKSKEEFVNPADVIVSGEDMVTGINPQPEEKVKEEFDPTSLTDLQNKALLSTIARGGRVSVGYAKTEVVAPLIEKGLLVLGWRYKEEYRNEGYELTAAVRESLKKVDWDSMVDVGKVGEILHIGHLGNFGRCRTAYWATKEGVEIAIALNKAYHEGLGSQLSKWEKDEEKEKDYNGFVDDEE